MKTNDSLNREECRNAMQKAIQSGDTEAYVAAWDEMFQLITAECEKTYSEKVEQMQAANDSRILSDRGHRQLTAAERDYFQKVLDAMKANDPKQALANLSAAIPETIVNEVFEELRTEHELLSAIDFIPANGFSKWLMDVGAENAAQWGDLCDEIIAELAGGFKVIETGLFKLSAFIFTCKSGFEIGPEWLDEYVREVLFEAFANGLEGGIITGTGKKMPIGMDRQCDEDVVTVGGVYPKKDAIEVTKFDIATVGNLISLLATSESGKPRAINNLILVCNPADYFSKIGPATMVLAPDGVYHSALPYDIRIIKSAAVPTGEAIFGISKGYFCAAGLTNGRIEFSDQYHFLEDERAWLIKGYANGLPKDNNYFLRLDISGVTPLHFAFENVTPVASDDATLQSLTIGSLTLSPTFDPDEDTYTATTTNTTNIIRAIANNASATVAITVGGSAHANGTAATWAAGSNTVVVTVTAEDGTTKAYTVTVTKS